MKKVQKNIILTLSALLFFGITSLNFSSNKYYVLTLDGNIEKAGKDEFGLPYKDIKFLSNFTGKIIYQLPENSSDIRESIKKAVVKGYEEKRSILSGAYDTESDRERLIIYMLLRINGSIPIYQSAERPPNDLALLLTSDKGNCTDYAVRLLMLLDVFGIQGRTVTIWTPSLYGHVIVDAYDPVEKKAYLLDPNFNVFSKFEQADKGFFDILFSMDSGKRKEYFENPESIKFFPFFVVGAENMGETIDEIRERTHLTVSDNWLATLIYEVPITINEWEKNTHLPLIRFR